MALVCWPYSLSSARPRRPAMLESEMTGKTTLIVLVETPRELVLAWLTGVTLADAATSLAPAPSADPGVPDGARMIQTTRVMITARIITMVRICMAAGRRRSRRQVRPNGAVGLNVDVLIVPLLSLIPVARRRSTGRPGDQQRFVAGTKVRRQRLRVSADLLGGPGGGHVPQLHDDDLGAQFEDQRHVVL